jgi:OmpA-OmpF porin, OOP family
MFDLLIREVAAKFGLGDKTGWILSTLLGFMFQKQSGGLGGLLDLFKQKGLASIASSWLGGGRGLPLGINPTQLENVIGSSLLKEIAAKTGLASGPIGGALAFMLPKIVRALTPDGVIPTGIPAAISQYLGAGVEKPAAPVRPAAASPTAVAPQTKGFPWWWILIPLILLIGWCALRKPAEAPLPAAETAPPAASAPASVAQINPTLVLNNDGGKIFYTGTVSDEVSKTSIIDAIKAAFGDVASGEIGVDKAAKGANWLAVLAQLLPELKSISGSKLSFDGDDITLDGTLPQSDIDGLLAKLKSVFGDKFNIKSIAQALTAAAPEPAAAPATPMDDVAKNAAAAAKMDELKATGNISGTDLVQALNLAVINFASGSAKISPSSMDILKKAAETLKAAADGTKVEIGGHTDNAGNPQSNMKLSEARANSVMATLVKLGVNAAILTARGYGDTKPLQPNDTPEGKAKNRRMEFSVAQ